MRSITNIFLLIICLAVVSYSQKVEIKDADNNILMEVNDEGRTGSILLKPGAEPTPFIDKLYNIGGAIYWNGLKLITDSDDGEWTLNGLNLYPTHLSSRVGIGMDSPSRTLEVQFNTGSGNTINPIAWFRTAGTGNSAGSIGFQNTNNNYYTVGITQDPDNDFAIGYNSNISLSSDLLRLKSNGFLEIKGKLKIADDLETPSAGVMRYTTSDGFEGYDGSAWLSLVEGGKWLENGNKIYYDLDYVGIGNTNPGFPLEVTRTNSGNNINPVASFRSVGANSSGSIRLQNSLDNYWVIGTMQDPDHSFAINYNNNISLTNDLFKITPYGTVGIGTTTPLYPLHVLGGDVEKTGYFANSSSNGFGYAVHGISVSNDANTNIGVYGQAQGDSTTVGVSGFGQNGMTNYGGYFSATSPDTNYAVYATVTTGAKKYAGYFEEGDVILENGNLGIGTTTPSAKMDVDGRIKVGDDPGATMVEPGTIRYNTTTDDFEGYNGEWVSLTGTNSTGVYGTVVNPITGKVWLDRNLGATQVATSSTDADSYGDLYQWGRNADGHQIRTSSTTAIQAIHFFTTSGEFIIGNENWLSGATPPTHMWSGTVAENNVCPSGFRIPTAAEWEQERLTWSSNDAAGAFASPLKLPMAGNRSFLGGSLNAVGSAGIYWSSTVIVITSTRSGSLVFDFIDAFVNENFRAGGFSVRCIKD